MAAKKNDLTSSIQTLSVAEQVQFALGWLKAHSTDHDRQNLVRFAINAKPAFGVAMAQMKVLAKQLGKDHDLAIALWDSGWYEARMVATMIDEPAKVTPAQMDRWCKDFDNWGIVDTACFCLFDRVPDAFKMVAKWRNRKAEFEKRAAFALLWSLSLHDKASGDDPFLKCLPFIEAAATDDRNFVKKAVNMALRAVGRRSKAVNAAAISVAERLAASADTSARWVGQHALRELRVHKFRN